MNLKELSENLGLSQTTVSRALNGYPEVSEATRVRVQTAAQQFNYIPSTRAKGLATGKALAIGHVIPMNKNHDMVNPIFGDFIAGAGAGADEEAVYRGLKSRRAVDGVVVHGPRMDDPRIPLLQEIGLPFVVHGRASGTTTPYAWVDVNNRRAFQRATDFLIDLGHRRIALINGIELMDFAHRRRAGYEDALNAKGIAIDPTLMVAEEMTETFGYRSTHQMLAAQSPPTAIVCASLICALGARRAIEDRGLVLGRDVSVVTHDDHLSYLQNGAEVPVFTATRSSVRDAGRKVGEMLINQIACPHGELTQTMLEAELMVGTSTGPAPTPES